MYASTMHYSTSTMVRIPNGPILYEFKIYLLVFIIVYMKVLENESLFQTLCGFVIYFYWFCFWCVHQTWSRMFLTIYSGQRSRGNPVYPEWVVLLLVCVVCSLVVVLMILSYTMVFGGYSIRQQYYLIFGKWEWLYD